MFKLETGVGGKKKVEKLQFKIFNSESREKKKGKGNFFFFFYSVSFCSQVPGRKKKKKREKLLNNKKLFGTPGELVSSNLGRRH